MRRPTLLYRPTATRVIIKINILVFLLWIFLDQKFMIDNFLVSWRSLQEGRVWTLLTSVFSHNLVFHIAVNMFAFYGFGTVLENVLGWKRFLVFYLLAGIVSSFGHSLLSDLLLGQPSLQALGASGAIAGIILLFSLMFPKEKILLLGIIPLPAITASLLFVGLDIWGLVAQTQGTSSIPIGHGAHLGGSFFGLIYFLIYRKQFQRDLGV
jgi:membrane associated rhomboid family serine protease